LGAPVNRPFGNISTVTGATINQGRKMRPPQVIGSVMLGVLVVVGCGKKDRDAPADAPAPGPNANPAAPTVPAQFVAARKTFDANCAKCHSTDPAGGGFPGGGKGLPLSRCSPSY
jgi:uncharacterized membrane protein